jgi:hypothetical protein
MTGDAMAKRKIKVKRRRGEGISISGTATVYVTRGVTLVVDASRESNVARVSRLERRKVKRRRFPPPRDKAPPCDGL